MTTGTNPFTSASISGYNSSPPDDDGSQTSANRVSWSKHKTKLADPIKTLAEADISNTSAAFAKTINTDDAVKNTIDGNLGFGSDTLTIATGAIVPDRSHHVIAAESGTADDLDTITNTNVDDGSLLLLRADTGDTITVRDGQDNIYLARDTNAVLDENHALLLMRVGTDWREIDVPGLAVGDTPTFAGVNLGAEDLSTYDEGYTTASWTPAVTFGGGSTGITYSTQYGYYVKIGKWCHAHGRLIFTSKGSSTGQARIAGLPFTAANISGEVAGPCIFTNVETLNYAATGLDLVGQVGGGSTTVGVIYNNVDNGAAVALADTDFSNNTQITFDIFYFTA